MAAEIEAIGGVAASDLGTRSGFWAPNPGAGTRALTSRAPEVAGSGSAAEVGLVFEVDRGSHDLIIKIVDRETNKVIREIPPEEMQSLRAAMQSILGAMLDRTG